MKKKLFFIVVIAVAAIGGAIYWYIQKNSIYNNPDFACGNGRLEATEIYVASKLSGKIEEIYVDEGDYVKKGQVLALMQTNVLTAELHQAQAKLKQAESEKISAEASIKQSESELAESKAEVAQKTSNMENSKSNYERQKELLRKQATAQQTHDNVKTLYLTAVSELEGAKAKVQKSEASVAVAKAGLEGAIANIAAAKADVERIQADLDDCKLISPRDGRVQYRIAQPGDVLSAGGRVLNLVDLSDVYMVFYLPEMQAGKAKIGEDVRLVLDAIPRYPLPAKVSFVANVAQFTPKTVETQIERQKLMFRVKAKIAPELLKNHLEYVKTGLPGVAWIKFNSNVKWPDFLRLNKPAEAKK